MNIRSTFFFSMQEKGREGLEPIVFIKKWQILCYMVIMHTQSKIDGLSLADESFAKLSGKL